MKPEDKNLDKVISEDELDAVAGGAMGRPSADASSGSASPLASSIRVCSAENANGSEAFAPNNK